MKTRLLFFCFFCLKACVEPVFADSESKNFAFADLSYNYLDWDRGTEKKSTKEDFSYLEIEGGSTYNWGELYGFFDLENPTKPNEEVRTAGKGALNYWIGNTKFGVYAHVYNFSAFGFSEQNRVLGLGTSLSGAGWWFKPFFGVHDVTQTYFSGTNGFMTGWAAGYFFNVYEQSLLVSNWHEHEFARKSGYARGNGGKSTSQNGALAIWWTPPQLPLSIGVQWRYATDKLGTGGAMNAVIYTIKYIL